MSPHSPTSGLWGRVSLVARASDCPVEKVGSFPGLCSKAKSLPHINASRASCRFTAQRFRVSLKVSLEKGRTGAATAGTKWEQRRTALYQSGLEILGKKEHRNEDWFEENWQEIIPAVEAKHAACLAHDNNPCPATRDDALRAARSKCQRTARRCANDYWQKLSRRIQVDADHGNSGSMYAGMKQATGPIPTKSIPLKMKTGESITDQRKQVEHWVEHYLKLYFTQNIVTDAALCAISQLPVMVELNEEATEEELRKAIDCLSAGKAPGEDGISPEVVKQGQEVLINDLHELLCLCWKEGAVPHDMRATKIVTLYKNKGWSQWLQQLQGHLSAEHCGQGVC